MRVEGHILFCQRAEQLYARVLSGSSRGPLTRHRYPDPGDPAYVGCPDLTFGHAEFCGDSATVLATYGCKRGQEEEDAQLYLFRWDGPVVALVSRQASAALGVTGGTARSGVCGVEPAG